MFDEIWKMVDDIFGKAGSVFDDVDKLSARMREVSKLAPSTTRTVTTTVKHADGSTTTTTTTTVTTVTGKKPG